MPDSPVGGMVLDDVSQRFLITLYPARVIRQADGDFIVYRLCIENRTEAWHRGFRAKVTPDPDLDPCLFFGAIPIEFGPIDLQPKSRLPADCSGHELRGLRFIQQPSPCPEIIPAGAAG